MRQESITTKASGVPYKVDFNVPESRAEIATMYSIDEGEAAQVQQTGFEAYYVGAMKQGNKGPVRDAINKVVEAEGLTPEGEDGAWSDAQVKHIKANADVKAAIKAHQASLAELRPGTGGRRGDGVPSQKRSQELLRDLRAGKISPEDLANELGMGD